MTNAYPALRCIVTFAAVAEPGKDENGRPANWWFSIPGEKVSAFVGIWRWSEVRVASPS